MTRNEAHPVELAALALLLVSLDWHPAPRPDAPQPVPVASAPIAASEAPAPGHGPRAGLRPNLQVATPAPPLDRLSVADLRRLARAVGLPCPLIRSGRRAQLLEALAAA